MNLIWTNLALSEYEHVIYYLLEEWSITEAQNFILTLNKTLDRIKENPNMFKSSATSPYLRKAKITSQNSLIYQIDGQEIIIIRVLDSRSDHNY